MTAPDYGSVNSGAESVSRLEVRSGDSCSTGLDRRFRNLAVLLVWDVFDAEPKEPVNVLECVQGIPSRIASAGEVLLEIVTRCDMNLVVPLLSQPTAQLDPAAGGLETAGCDSVGPRSRRRVWR